MFQRRRRPAAAAERARARGGGPCRPAREVVVGWLVVLSWGRVTEEVLALLQERQDRRKAELDASRRDVQFAVGDEVLLDTEHTPLPGVG